VLARAAAYVSGFERDLSGIVAEEHYVQDVSTPFTSTFRGAPPPDLSGLHRELTSDLLLVRPAGSDRYLQFRDVFVVNGDQVRDRSDRLLKLFVEPTASSFPQAGRIMDESARYNIGSVERNINVPIFALTFLDPVNQPRFRFTDSPSGRGAAELKSAYGADFSSSVEVLAVEYRETAPHTLIHTNGGRDLPARGRFWIEAPTGRVLKTELVAEDSRVHGLITVMYQLPSVVGFLVPIEMRETYWQTGGDQRIEGVATYTNFRRFNVTTDTSIAVPSP